MIAIFKEFSLKSTFYDQLFMIIFVRTIDNSTLGLVGRERGFEVGVQGFEFRMGLKFQKFQVSQTLQS